MDQAEESSGSGAGHARSRDGASCRRSSMGTNVPHSSQHQKQALASELAKGFLCLDFSGTWLRCDCITFLKECISLQLCWGKLCWGKRDAGVPNPGSGIISAAQGAGESFWVKQGLPGVARWKQGGGNTVNTSTPGEAQPPAHNQQLQGHWGGFVV